MKKNILYLIFLFIVSYGFSQYKINEDFKKYGISAQEYKILLQKSLNLNHIDFFFLENEKKKPVVLLKSEYIEPISDTICLTKFGNPIKIKSYKEIYEDMDVNFIDFIEVFMIKDKLTISYGFYNKHFVVFAEFLKYDNEWELITKDINEKPKAIVNLALTKGVCLSQLLKCKLNKGGDVCAKCVEKFPNIRN
ncbi:hypothetical protein [uncultured Mesonia sp.]|uniref:hypothetical protein n=1 Tax=uncultured Mesonia sp. TaxID=399731 RepID=UPI00374E49CA